MSERISQSSVPAFLESKDFCLVESKALGIAGGYIGGCVTLALHLTFL